MVEINPEFVFFMGMTSIISPMSLPFVGIVVGLTIVTIKTEKRIFSIISMIVIGVVFVGSHFTMIVFPIGPLLGTLLSTNDHVLTSVFFLGGVSIPSVITVYGFLKVKQRKVNL